MIIITGYSDVFDQMVQTDTGVTSMCLCITPKPARDKMRDGADQNDDNLRISDHCRVRVTVRIRAGVRVRVRIGIWVRVRVKDRNRDRLGLGLRIVVYKLLEKVTKCGSIT